MKDLITYINQNYVGIKKPDKYNTGYVHSFYNDLFTPLRNKKLNILEIGIFNGDSLLLWHNFFKKSKITGIDILKKPNTDFLFTLPRINCLYNDAYQDKFLCSLYEKKFDIIIDDGPHTLESMKCFLKNYLNFLSDDGYLILEDIEYEEWLDKLIPLVEKENYKIYNTKETAVSKKFANKYKSGLYCIVVNRGK